MNEQLQAALATLLGKTIDGIDSSVAFVQSELPDVIQQLLTWYMVVNAIYAIIAIAIPFIYYKLARAAYIKMNEDIEAGVIISMVGIIPAIASLILINVEWLQIIIAPKIWLIEYAASLAK